MWVLATQLSGALPLPTSISLSKRCVAILIHAHRFSVSYPRSFTVHSLYSLILPNRGLVFYSLYTVALQPLFCHFLYPLGIFLKPYICVFYDLVCSGYVAVAQKVNPKHSDYDIARRIINNWSLLQYVLPDHRSPCTIFFEISSTQTLMNWGSKRPIQVDERFCILIQSQYGFGTT